MPVLIVGSIGIDEIKTPTEHHKELLGGSASYAAIACSFLAPARLLGIVGEDFPDAHSKLFQRHRIDTTGLTHAQGKTFRWCGEYEAEMNNRRTLSVELGVFEHYLPRVPASYIDTDFVLLANGAPQLQTHVLDQLENPKFVVADTMDLWISIAREPLLALLKRVNMLILNDSEARALTSESNLIRAGRQILAMGPKFVTIKKGEHGAMLFSDCGGIYALPAYPLEEVFDPTGAGDCFAGGLVGHCAKVGDASFDTLKDALFHGTVMASFNVEAFSTRRLDRLTENELLQRQIAFKKVIGHTR